MNSGEQDTVDIEEIISLITGHIETYSEQMFPCDIVSAILENLSNEFIDEEDNWINKAFRMSYQLYSACNTCSIQETSQQSKFVITIANSKLELINIDDFLMNHFPSEVKTCKVCNGNRTDRIRITNLPEVILVNIEFTNIDRKPRLEVQVTQDQNKLYELYAIGLKKSSSSFEAIGKNSITQTWSHFTYENVKILNEDQATNQLINQFLGYKLKTSEQHNNNLRMLEEKNQKKIKLINRNLKLLVKYHLFLGIHGSSRKIINAI